MGDLAVNLLNKKDQKNQFIQHVLKDVQALDKLIEDNHFENDIQRIGAEQELSLTDLDGMPLSKGPEILSFIKDERVTTEIGRFNLEINLDPHDIVPDCLSKMEAQLIQMLKLVQKKADLFDGKVFLGGILPTLQTKHLTFDHITPENRYIALSKRLHEMRGNDFEIRIEGTDELLTKLDSVLFEACNTSFQLHLQIPSHKFVEQHNWAQWIAAPILGVSANSPHLLNKELWMETRIALFQQSIDTRTPYNTLRYRQPRVSFGRDWIYNSAADIFKEQIARFPLLITKDIKEDALEQMELGITPKLKALRTHNGTVYSWNRACYGISENGMPHLRIEARYIPSGPTAIDEMANFAFWLGLQKAGEVYGKGLNKRVKFSDAKNNFTKAAKEGLNTKLRWYGKAVGISSLILGQLIPIAREGLKTFGISTQDIDKYLGIIESRTNRGTNGAIWQSRNYRKMLERWTPALATQELTKIIMERQQDQTPVHEWEDIECPVTISVQTEKATVGQWMTTDIFTVHENDPLSLVKAVMDWKKIRHIPVENDNGELTGLITRKTWKKVSNQKDTWAIIPASKIMVTDLITADETLTLDAAIQKMLANSIGCLPIVENEKLIGIITDTDIRKLLKHVS